MTMPAINYIEHECTMQCDPDCNTQGASYIRADIVEELVGKMKALRDDAYGYDYLYETPFHGQVCETIDAALSRINAIMEGSE